MKWSDFSYNYGWSNYVFLLDGWIAKCSMGVPIVGYLILFNDTVSQHLSFNLIASEGVGRLGISSSARLKLIYFGLIFLGTANIFYRLRRPFTFSIGTNRFDYVEHALRHFTASSYINIHDVIRHEGHRTLHGKYDDEDYDDFLDGALGREEGDKRGFKSGNWAAAKNKHEQLLRSMLTENFFRNNIKRRYSLTACIATATLGYLFLLIPSMDLFLKVLIVSLRPLIF